MNQAQTPVSILAQKLGQVRGILLHSLLCLLIVLYLEGLLHAVVFHSLTARFLYILGFSIPVALILSLLLGLLPKRANTILSICLVSVLCVIFGSQLVYFFVFGNLYSLSRVSLGGDAIASFWRETLLTMGEHIGVMLLCVLPIPAVCLVRRFLPEVFEHTSPKEKPGAYVRAILLALAVLFQAVTVLSLRAGGTGFYSPHSIYYGHDATVKQTADSFGLLTAVRLELTRSDADGEETGYYTELPSLPETPAPTDSPSPEATPKPEYGWNLLNIDLDTLNGLTKDEKLLALNSYISSLPGTRKNEYTGMLSDYNLIVLCGESFSTAALDPVLTPTLYRLAHEGFVFNNYYNTFPDCTSDGEYSLCLGLLPDNSRGKTAPSFYASRNSYLPMALGNIFSEQREIQGHAYHNYIGSYYGRNLTHANMGYTCKFAGKGMSFTTSFPSSDLEMMEQSIPDFIGEDQFLAYYMTFSGHMKYDRSVNPMSRRNYDLVKDLPYSEAAKCYLSGNIELDKAMAYLMEQLEEQGVADHTAIVLAGDHYPYGLTRSQYDELIGHETDFFEKYHDTLIFWVGGLEEPIPVDTYCCNIDVLPTILNLWGLDFDSRLLAGTDVFAPEASHTAILIDQSFLTDKVWFNANTNSATYLVPEEEVPENYLENLIRTVKNKFSFSIDVLNTAYYNFIFDAGSVSVTKAGWISEEAWFGTGKKEDPPAPTPEEPVESGALPSTFPTALPEATPGASPETPAESGAPEGVSPGTPPETPSETPPVTVPPEATPETPSGVPVESEAPDVSPDPLPEAPPLITLPEAPVETAPEAQGPEAPAQPSSEASPEGQDAQEP